MPCSIGLAKSELFFHLSLRQPTTLLVLLFHPKMAKVDSEAKEVIELVVLGQQMISDPSVFTCKV